MTSGFWSIIIIAEAGYLYAHEFVPSEASPILMLYDITDSCAGVLGPFAYETTGRTKRSARRNFFILK